MINPKTLLVAAMVFNAMTSSAEIVECLTVTTGAGSQKFAISEIREVTFADDGMTVIKTDGASTSFATGWQMTFSLEDFSGFNAPVNVSAESSACVYTVDGHLVGSYSHLSDFKPELLAPGTYLIVSNGKTLKIQR